MIRNFHLPGRSEIHALNEAAATSHPLATQTAMDILSKGGNSVDAAIAACAVLCVVEPHMTGIGGDCFILIAEPDGELFGLNGSGHSPTKLDPTDIQPTESNHVSEDSIHAVTAPGSVKAWETIHKSHGKLPFSTLLQPSIRYAKEGFAVAPRVAGDWNNLVGKLSRDETAKHLYLPDGRAPDVGQIMKFPQLADTLSRIAENGADAFYTGPVAEDIARTVKKYGGFLDEDDLANVEAISVKPITSDYRGTTVAELPPNGQGIIALLILGIIERFEMSKFDPLGPDRVHIALEASRLAYSVRNRFISDSDYSEIDITDILKSGFVDKLSDKINLETRMDSINPSELSPGSDTVYLTVVDSERRAVSMINSLFHGFGSGICTEKTGIMLQNRGACFTLEKNHPNCIAPGKRPLHTIIPAMALRNNKPWLSFGVMGGAYQPCGHAHVISNLTDYGMSLQSAVDHPRWFLDDTLESVELELGVPDQTVQELQKKGHNVNICQDPIGGSQAILIDETNGGLIGASDPRKDGCAIGR